MDIGGEKTAKAAVSRGLHELTARPYRKPWVGLFASPDRAPCDDKVERSRP